MEKMLEEVGKVSGGQKGFFPAFFLMGSSSFGLPKIITPVLLHLSSSHFFVCQQLNQICGFPTIYRISFKMCYLETPAPPLLCSEF
jgi:hypothetical protein